MTCIVKIWYQTEQKNQGHQNKGGWGAEVAVASQIILLKKNGGG